MTEDPGKPLETVADADDFIAELKADAPKLINGPADRSPIERDSFLDSRVAVFIVTLPKGMTTAGAQVFKQEVNSSLEVIIRDAQMTVDSFEIERGANADHLEDWSRSQ